MEITCDYQESRNIENLTQLRSIINSFPRSAVGFCILEDGFGNYAQCAGSGRSLTVEWRRISGTSFKHFVVGIGETKSPMKINWVGLNTGAGQIMIHDDEVVDISHALIVFEAFFLEKEIPTNFRKRNVTKRHVNRSK